MTTGKAGSLFVTWAQATGLAAVGYPQDRFPQAVWWWDDDSPHNSDGSPKAVLQWVEDGIWKIGRFWHAAPPYVTGDGEEGALEWLEQEKGWQWQRSAGEWMAWSTTGGSSVDTASGLLDAILDRMNPQGKGEPQ